jgi:hypothetical protein
MMKPDTSKMEERKKMALFESRLESLEKVLGPSQQKLVRLFFLAHAAIYIKIHAMSVCLSLFLTPFP